MGNGRGHDLHGRGAPISDLITRLAFTRHLCLCSRYERLTPEEQVQKGVNLKLGYQLLLFQDQIKIPTI